LDLLDAVAGCAEAVFRRVQLARRPQPTGPGRQRGEQQPPPAAQAARHAALLRHHHALSPVSNNMAQTPGSGVPGTALPMALLFTPWGNCRG